MLKDTLVDGAQNDSLINKLNFIKKHKIENILVRHHDIIYAIRECNDVTLITVNHRLYNINDVDIFLFKEPKRK